MKDEFAEVVNYCFITIKGRKELMQEALDGLWEIIANPDKTDLNGPDEIEYIKGVRGFIGESAHCGINVRKECERFGRLLELYSHLNSLN